MKHLINSPPLPRVKKNMKLHQIKLPAKIYEKVSDGSKFFTVDHLDGLYYYCESEKGGVCHLHVMEELEPYKDGYKFKAKFNP